MLLTGATAQADFPNGQWPSSALDNIAGGLNHAGKPQTAFLAKGAVSADFNTFNLCATADGVPLSPGPSSYSPAATAYRPRWIQVILRNQLGGNAAIPGHSNHGNAKAVDFRTLQMRAYIDKHGARFGISKRTSRRCVGMVACSDPAGARRLRPAGSGRELPLPEPQGRLGRQVPGPRRPRGPGPRRREAGRRVRQGDAQGAARVRARAPHEAHEPRDLRRVAPAPQGRPRALEPHRTRAPSAPSRAQSRRWRARTCAPCRAS
jgi:hypothetical protein